MKLWLGRCRVTIWPLTDFTDEPRRALWGSRRGARGPTEAP